MGPVLAGWTTCLSVISGSPVLLSRCDYLTRGMLVPWLCHTLCRHVPDAA
jgi:hypothetical protein